MVSLCNFETFDTVSPGRCDSTSVPDLFNNWTWGVFLSPFSKGAAAFELQLELTSGLC